MMLIILIESILLNALGSQTGSFFVTDVVVVSSQIAGEIVASFSSIHVEMGKVCMMSCKICALPLRWSYSSRRSIVVGSEQDTFDIATISWHILSLTASFARTIGIGFRRHG